MRKVGLLGVSLLCFSLSGVAGRAATFEEIAAGADAARVAHDIPRAIELYRNAVALQPDWHEGWWFLGTLLYGSSQYADARDAVRHLADLSPNAAPAWGLLGLCESETGDYAAALGHIQQSLALDTGGPSQLKDVFLSREAMLLTRNGQFEKAMEKYTQFLRGGAPSDPLLVALGLAALRQPLLPKEIPDGHQELIVSAGRASLAMISGDARSAEKSLRELVKAHPSEPGLHYLYASWLIRSDEDAAAAELNRELAIAPRSAAANEMLSWIILTHGDTGSALEHAEAAVRADPDTPVAQLVWGRALAETGHVQDGITHLQKAATVDPKNLEARIALASAFEQAGMYQDAIRERRAAVKIKEAAHGAAN